MPKRKPKSRRRRLESSRESRAAEAMTIGWLLAALTTLVCELAAAAAAAYLHWQAEVKSIAVLYSVMMFASLVLGLCTLGLTVLVWRLRRVKPPPAITAFAVLVGTIPAVVMLLQAL